VADVIVVLALVTFLACSLSVSYTNRVRLYTFGWTFSCSVYKLALCVLVFSSWKSHVDTASRQGDTKLMPGHRTGWVE